MAIMQALTKSESPREVKGRNRILNPWERPLSDVRRPSLQRTALSRSIHYSSGASTASAIN